MECSICKNKRGFVFGTCIECGYNYLDNTYHTIEVNTEALKCFVPPDVFDYFVKQHENSKRDLYNI